MKKFHAHLYFRPDREPDARALYALAENRSGVDFKLWKFYPLCVGPHALPMMEFHFTERTEAAALDWLTEHHGAFSVLIHEETGNDVRDHESNVRWLGNPLPIHFEFFKQVAAPSPPCHSSCTCKAHNMLANPNEILHFIEIFKTKHITKAAIRLGITQPSLTQSLQKLEEKLGAPLFLRTKQGVVPTRQGSLFHAKAQKLLETWREIQDGVRNSTQELEGRFRVGCHASVGTYTLPLFFQNLNESAPKLQIDLIHDFSRKINEGIISYQIDLGFVVNPVRHPDLVLKKLGNDRVLFWKKKGQKQIPKKIFADSSLNQIEVILGKTHAKHFPDFSLVQTESLELIRMLAQSGQGIAILPERIARLNGGDLEVYDPKLPVFLDEIHLAYRKEALSSRAGKELVRLAHLQLCE